MLFSIDNRNEIRTAVIRKAKLDTRIVSAAVIGSYSRGEVDRWSDIDLTFGIEDSVPVRHVLDSMTEYMIHEFQAVVLFDVSRGTTIYRVFILPGCLQIDLSFSPASQFGAIGKHFTLLYGNSVEKPQPHPQQPREMFGYMMHHLLRARFCAERQRLWQAEFWLTESRNYALKLACIARNLSPDYGRGYDDLPREVLELFADSFVTKLTKEEILRCLQEIVAGISISTDIRDSGGEFKSFLATISATSLG